MDLSGGVLYGILGGALPEFYGLYKLREDFHSKRPRWIKSRFYWMVTVGMILLGGGVVALYISTGTTLNPVLALHIGAATPTLIANFAKGRLEIEPTS